MWKGIRLLSKSNNRECHPEAVGRTVWKEAGGQRTVAVKLTKCRTGLPRRLMRGNPENYCLVSLVSIFSKIIGQMCPEKNL